MAVVREGVVYHIEVAGISDGQAVINIFDYIVQDFIVPGVFTSEESLLLNEFRDAWRGNVLPLLGSSYAVQQYRMFAYDAKQINEEYGGIPEAQPPYAFKPFPSVQFLLPGVLGMDQGK